MSPRIVEGQRVACAQLTVTNTGTGSFAVLQFSTSTPAGWLSASPPAFPSPPSQRGGLPAGQSTVVTLTCDAGALSAGLLSSFMQFNANYAANAARTTVDLTVSSSTPDLSVSTTSLSATGVSGGPSTTRTFSVSNTQGGTLSYSVSSPEPWLSESPPSGTSTGEADTITVTFDPATLAPGHHDGTIQVAAPGATNAPKAIAVGFDLLPPPTLVVAPTTLAISVIQGQNAPASSFTVANSGTGTVSYSAAEGIPWLSVSPVNGTATTETDTIGITFSTASLAAGPYTGIITVSPNGGGTSSTVTVGLTVLPPPTLELSTTALRVSSSLGHDAAPRTFQVRNGMANAGILSYTITDDQPWMSVAPSAGTSSGEQDTITVSFATASLAQGKYVGQIGILAPGATGAPAAIQVSLTVGAQDGVAAFDPKTGRWLIRRAEADSLEASFLYGGGGFVPLYGDWDGDGVATVGAFQTSTATWYLRNGTGAGAADRIFQYGPGGAVPVTGDWDGVQGDGIGVYVPSNATWYLRNAANGGAADAGVFAYGYGGVLPVVGDWNGDGTDTVGIYDPGTGNWLLRNAPGGGPPSVTLNYGYAGTRPISGDWDGNGSDGIGLFDPTQGKWLLRETAANGVPDRVLSTPRAKDALAVRVPWSAPDLPTAVDVTDPSGPGDLVALFDVPTGEWLLQYDLAETSLVRSFSYLSGGSFTAVHGDWDGDGVATLGVYQAAIGRWYLRNGTGPGPADIVFDYGFPGTVPVVGDWDGNQTDTVGLYYPVTAQWLLRNQNTPGAADLAFAYGFGGVQPVVGDWNGDKTDTVGIYHAATGTWYLRNAAGGGPAALVFNYGYPGTVPLAGDWDGDGTDGVGLYDRTTGRLLLRNAASSGAPDVNTAIQGRTGAQPLVWRP